MSFYFFKVQLLNTLKKKLHIEDNSFRAIFPQNDWSHDNSFMTIQHYMDDRK